MNIPTPEELPQMVKDRENKRKAEALAEQVLIVEREFEKVFFLPFSFEMIQKPKKTLIQLLEQKGYAVVVEQVPASWRYGDRGAILGYKSAHYKVSLGAATSEPSLQ